MKRCARCQAAISSSELVMRARELVFHVACFTCALCHAPLSKGDHFGLREGAVLCRLHYETLPALPPASPTPAFPPPPGPPGGPGSEGGGGGFSPAGAPPGASFRAVPPSPQGLSPSGGGLSGALPPGAAMMPLGPHGALPALPALPHMGLATHGPGAGPDPKLPFFNGGVPQVVAPGPRQKGRPRKRKPKEMEGITAAMGKRACHPADTKVSPVCHVGDMGGDSYLDGPFGPGTPGLHGNSRSKRMRTSFKHHQLRTMKSYFAINHNPDAKDLKQLSQKTGLPKRVLQVWFQNARAKWRRLMLKQEGKGGDKCGGDSPGDMDHGFAGALGGAPGGPHSPQFILGGSPLEC
ncbi:Protein apterous [Frankliniella fusca]|uniref:Protein apterous n=1 Tax=Frankliniella fusca TaxID=407009 RepID=A0AAE1HMX6_9NEOP|nr:Protein apterous [Frankliniella fusca]